MSGKNGRIILGGLIAAGIVVVAVAAVALSIGAFALFGAKGDVSPTPVATPGLMPSPTTAPAIQNPFYIYSMVTDKASRTYRINLQQAPGAMPVDISRLAVKAQADGVSYDVWNFDAGEYVWSGNQDGDSILNGGEIFSMTIDIGQAGVPLWASSPLKLTLLVDNSKALELNMTPV